MHKSTRIAFLLVWALETAPRTVDALAKRACSYQVHAYLEEALMGGRPNQALAARLGTCACIYDDTSGFTPLHEVANRAGGNVWSLVDTLVKNFASTLETDRTEATALHVAARHGSDLAVAAICDAATNAGVLRSLFAIREEGDGGGTALDVAEMAGHVPIAKRLVELGAFRAADTSAPPEGTSLQVCSSELVDAALLGNADRMAGLLQKHAQQREVVAANATVDNETKLSPTECLVPPASNGKTLLHLAVAARELQSKRRDAVTPLLLKHGADPSRQDAKGETALASAARTDQEDAVSALLERSPPGTENSGNALGSTPLHEASKLGCARATRALLMHGARADVRDWHGLTPMDYAVREGFSDISAVLEKADALRAAGSKAMVQTLSSALDDVVDLVDEPFPKRVAVLLGMSAGMFLAVSVVCLWLWSKRNSKTAISAMTPITAAASKECGDGDEALRKAAVGKILFQDEVGAAKVVPPGRVVGRNGGSSDEDSGDSTFGSLVKHGRRLRRKRGGADGDSPEQPIVIVAPNRGPGAEEFAQAPAEIMKLQGPGHAIPEAVSNQLQAELRHMKQPKERERERDRRGGAAATASFNEKSFEAASPVGSAAAVAALSRLPTPPMDTTEPITPESRNARGPDRHATKRTHAPPRPLTGDTFVPAALRDNARSGELAVPPAFRQQASRESGVPKSRRQQTVDDIAVPAALRDDPPPTQGGGKKGRRR